MELDSHDPITISENVLVFKDGHEHQAAQEPSNAERSCNVVQKLQSIVQESRREFVCPTITLKYVGQTKDVQCRDDAIPASIRNLFQDQCTVIAWDPFQMQAASCIRQEICTWKIQFIQEKMHLRHTHNLIGNLKRANHLCFSPSGNFLVASCDEGTIRIWDTVRGTHLLAAHFGGMHMCKVWFIGGGDTHMHSMDDSGAVHAWNLERSAKAVVTSTACKQDAALMDLLLDMESKGIIEMDRKGSLLHPTMGISGFRVISEDETLFMKNVTSWRHEGGIFISKQQFNNTCQIFRRLGLHPEKNGFGRRGYNYRTGRVWVYDEDMRAQYGMMSHGQTISVEVNGASRSFCNILKSNSVEKELNNNGNLEGKIVELNVSEQELNNGNLEGEIVEWSMPQQELHTPESSNNVSYAKMLCSASQQANPSSREDASTQTENKDLERFAMALADVRRMQADLSEKLGRIEAMENLLSERVAEVVCFTRKKTFQQVLLMQEEETPCGCHPTKKQKVQDESLSALEVLAEMATRSMIDE